MDSNVFTFPGANPPPEATLRRDHAQAFRDMESEVCDLERWGEIAEQLTTGCACDARSWRELELAVLVVHRLSRLVADFRAGYYRAWEEGAGEERS